MIFNTTHRYNTNLSIDEIKKRLIGKHVKIHNLDFEIYEKEGIIKIIPHAEQIDEIKSLPISHVHLNGSGGKTNVRLTSHMRRIDSGGPTLVVIFSFFMMLAGLMFYLIGKKDFLYSFAIPLFGIGILIFGILMVRLRQGYYDYVHKVKTYVRSLTQAA